MTKPQAIPKSAMGRPKLHLTEEARLAALRVSWRLYNETHRSQKAEHNKEYVRRPEVKQRIKEKRRAAKKLVEADAIAKANGGASIEAFCHRTASCRPALFEGCEGPIPYYRGSVGVKKGSNL